MCIAIIKPYGAKMPKKKRLARCWENNDDGAGYMVYNEYTKKMEITKGFMTFDSFYDSISKQQFSKTDLVGIHFRIGTSSYNTAPNTHPFPLSQQPERLKALTVNSKTGIIHNGVVGKGETDLSDTMVFIRDVLYHLRHHLDEDNTLKAIENISLGNKFAIFRNGKVYFTGKWHKSKGCWFSNETYKTIRRTYAGFYSNGYDNGFDDDYGSDYERGISNEETRYSRYAEFFEGRHSSFLSEEERENLKKLEIDSEIAYHKEQMHNCPTEGCFGQLDPFVDETSEIMFQCSHCGTLYDIHFNEFI
jgi:hypothetical protein